MTYYGDPSQDFQRIAGLQALTIPGDDRRYFACACVGGENCCIKVAKRKREAAIRADERRKVMAELGAETERSI